MRVFHIPERRIGSKRPQIPTHWAEGHASPEDRALGLELELIELERRRHQVAEGSGHAQELDAEIEAVRRELVEVASLPDLPSVA